VNTARRWLPFYLPLALIWGCSFLFIKVGLDSFSPVGVAFGRIFLGALTLIGISLVLRSRLPPRWSWKYLFVVSLLWVSIPWMLFSFAETQVSSALAGIINALTPLMTLAAIVVAFREEKPTGRRIAGLVMGFIGMLIVVGVWQPLALASTWAIGGLIVAVACYGMGFPFARRYLTGPSAREPIPALSLATGLLLWGVIITTPIALITGIGDGPFTAASIASVAALGILGSGIAYLLNFQVTQRADATTASTVTYLTPLVAVIAGAVILGEQLSWNQPVGGVIVVLGAAVAQGLLPRGTPSPRTRSRRR